MKGRLGSLVGVAAAATIVLVGAFASAAEPAKLTKADYATMYTEFLKEEGFKSEVNPHDEVQFKFEGRTWYIELHEDDGFFAVYHQLAYGSDAERIAAQAAANTAGWETKTIKLLVGKHGVDVSCQTFLPAAQDFRRIFYRCLSAVQYAIEQYQKALAAAAATTATPPVDEGSPVWVQRGSGMVSGPKGRLIQGVAKATGFANAELARQILAKRARAEIVKQGEVLLASLVKEIMMTPQADDLSEAQVDELYEQLRQSLEGTVDATFRLADQWSGSDGTLWGLAQVNLAAVKERAAKLKLVPVAAKFVGKHLDRLHAQLEKELADQAGAAP